MKYAVLLAASLTIIVLVFTEGEVSHGPGMVAPETPVQSNLQHAESFRVDQYQITPLADFQVTARVLSKERYYFGRESELSPLDLALGWGPMSDEEVLRKIKITQSARWYYWKSRDLPIRKSIVVSHSANMHIIPATEELRDRLIHVRKGEVISFTGKLVKITARDGFHWESSMSREDSGGHSCEVVWVESLQVQ